MDGTGYTYKSFDETKSIFVHVPKCAGISVCKALYGNLAGGHMTLGGYATVFEPKSLHSYFKFTFVRNPYSRLVSAFHFLRQGGMNEADKRWFEKELAEYGDFQSFVRGWLNTDNVMKYWHFMPQHHFLIDPRGLVSLDYVGRMETLDDDFAYVASKLHSPAVLPKSNGSSHASYQSYYDEETKDIVSEVYSRDLNMLGYDFDGFAEKALSL